MKNKVLVTLILGLGLLLVGGAAQATPIELITNGGFETGDLTGWYSTGPNVQPIYPNSGVYAAYGRSWDFNDMEVIAQTIPTIAGETYNVSFYYLVQAYGSGLHAFRYQIEEELVFLSLYQTWPYVVFSTSFVASEDRTRLVLGFQGDGQFLIDDVSVTRVAVPEPASLLLLGSGFGGIGLAAWRGRKWPFRAPQE